MEKGQFIMNWPFSSVRATGEAEPQRKEFRDREALLLRFFPPDT